MHFRSGEGFVGLCVSESRPFRVDDVSKDPRFVPQEAQTFQIGSLMCEPMWSSGEVVGVLSGDPAEALRMTRYRSKLRDGALAKNIPALEITELTERSWPANKELFGERIHPNAAGHRLMAERLAKFLTESPALLQSK